VGKAGCLRAAVVGHLGEDRGGGRDRKLRDAVCRVDWEETAGELGAQLRELECVRAGAPLFNRQAKSETGGLTLRSDEDTGAVSVQPLAEVAAADLEGCFGVFSSAHDARKALADIAAARQLCPKVLGLEESAGSCLGYQLGRCKGACAGREPAALHALRVRMALAPLKLKPWPFRGRVALRERRAYDEAELHIVDRWRYVGTARSDEELAAVAARALPETFDVPVYKILVRYFANHPRLDWHDLETRPLLDDGARPAVDVCRPGA
jgi:DNA polymerase III subunit epsilon